MRASGHNLFNAIAVQYLNILIGHHLKEKFIAGPACGITCATLFFSQDGVVDLHLVEDLCKGFCNPLGPLIEASGTAHPKKDLG